MTRVACPRALHDPLPPGVPPSSVAFEAVIGRSGLRGGNQGLGTVRKLALQGQASDRAGTAGLVGAVGRRSARDIGRPPVGIALRYSAEVARRAVGGDGGTGRLAW